MPNAIGEVRTWQDTGAPSLAPGNGNLQDLLKAVLVDGYGSYDPLGWSMEYDDTLNDVRVFRNDPAGTGFYLST